MALTAPWSIAQATPQEAADALSILQEVSRWLVDIGRPTWPIDGFRLETLEQAALAGELVLGYQCFTAVASMLLQTRDGFYWPSDPPGEALYVHKVAVRRSAAGQNWSGRLIEWAQAKARSAGARFLRLDTVDQDELLSLYRGHGFYVVDEQPRRVGDLMMYRLELPVLPRP